MPVCYDLALGPDLEDVAAFGACSIEDVIALHASRTYRVYMVGFIPGFAYLAEVDQRIARPRRAAPRTAVPAGSVAIAGGQTGIYPKVTPGGWNIIGRTPLKPYDPDRDDPFLFRVGDDVRFMPDDARRIRAERRMTALHGDSTGTADHRAGPRPVGLPGPRRARRGADGRLLAPARQPSRRERRAGGRTGNHAGRAGASRRRASFSARSPAPCSRCSSMTRRVECGQAVPRRERRHAAVRPQAGRRALDPGVPRRDRRAAGARQPCDESRQQHGTVRRTRARRRRSRPDRPRGSDGSARSPRVSRCVFLKAARACAPFRARTRRASQPWRSSGCSPRPSPSPRSRIAWDSGSRALSCSYGEAADILSDATPLGSLQVPRSGQPILLMADRQTTGGYPKIATVIAADLPLAGQLAPGDWIRFVPCTRADALDALNRLERRLAGQAS